MLRSDLCAGELGLSFRLPRDNSQRPASHSLGKSTAPNATSAAGQDGEWPSFIRALTWSIGAEIISRLLQPITFVALATILSPTELGVVAAAMIVISFCNILWDAGMGKALVQTKDDIKSACDAAFFVNATITSVIIVLLLAFSTTIAVHLFNDTRVAGVIRALCVNIALGAFSSVQLFLLQKQMNFRAIFWMKLSAAVAPLVISIPLALVGFSFWSLVIGTISGQTLQVLLLLKWKLYWPSLNLNRAVVERMVRFGSWVMGAGILAWFYGWADALVIGMAFGPREVGLYRTSIILVSYLFGALFTPVLPVIYSQLSKHHGEGGQVRPVFTRAVRMMTLLALPLAAFVYVFAPYVEAHILGAQWNGIAFITSQLAIMIGFSTIVSANGEAYRAIGEPHLEAVVTGSLILVYLAGYFVSIRYGLHAFVYTRVSLALFALVVHLALAQYTRILDVRDLVSTFVSALLAGGICILAFWAQAKISYLGARFELFYAFPCFCLVAAALWGLQRKSIVSDFRALVSMR